MTILKTLLCLVLCVAFGLAPVVFAEDPAEPAPGADAGDKARAAQAAPETAEPTETKEPSPKSEEGLAGKTEMTQVLDLAAVAVCRKVEDRTPVEDGTSFPTDVGRLFCFTDVRNAQKATQIFHRWYVGETMVDEIPMTVKGPRWRCWSEKTILTSWKGACRVEIVTEDGSVIGELTFGLEEGDASLTEPSTQEPSAG
jgi:hypothetical protein